LDLLRIGAGLSEITTCRLPVLFPRAP
jgi:hypothetical protein